MKTPLLLLACATLCCTALLPGCAGYQLGTTLPAHLRTIAVTGFINETGEPDLEAAVTRATLQEFQRDGTLVVADRDTADIVLEGKIVSCDFAAVRYERGNRLASEEQRMTIACEILATERATGKTLHKGSVEGDTTFLSGGDLTTAKRTAYRAAAEDVAHEIVNAVISAW
ncbi:MAG: LPS assembly lipoprotein LptE [Kiritimatiellia bacterium]|jgi:hypothetical protein